MIDFAARKKGSLVVTVCVCDRSAADHLDWWAT